MSNLNLSNHRLEKFLQRKRGDRPVHAVEPMVFLPRDEFHRRQSEKAASVIREPLELDSPPFAPVREQKRKLRDVFVDQENVLSEGHSQKMARIQRGSRTPLGYHTEKLVIKPYVDTHVEQAATSESPRRALRDKTTSNRTESVHSGYNKTMSTKGSVKSYRSDAESVASYKSNIDKLNNYGDDTRSVKSYAGSVNSYSGSVRSHFSGRSVLGAIVNRSRKQSTNENDQPHPQRKQELIGKVLTQPSTSVHDAPIQNLAETQEEEEEEVLTNFSVDGDLPADVHDVKSAAPQLTATLNKETNTINDDQLPKADHASDDDHQPDVPITLNKLDDDDMNKPNVAKQISSARIEQYFPSVSKSTMEENQPTRSASVDVNVNEPSTTKHTSPIQIERSSPAPGNPSMDDMDDDDFDYGNDNHSQVSSISHIPPVIEEQRPTAEAPQPRILEKQPVMTEEQLEMERQKLLTSIATPSTYKNKRIGEIIGELGNVAVSCAINYKTDNPSYQEAAFLMAERTGRKFLEQADMIKQMDLLRYQLLKLRTVQDRMRTRMVKTQKEQSKMQNRRDELQELHQKVDQVMELGDINSKFLSDLYNWSANQSKN